MKKFLLLNFILLLPLCVVKAQFPLPLAPEVWSVPEKIAVISEWSTRAQRPSISFDKQKLYFEGLAVTEWDDTGWTVPQSLPSHINQHLARYPCISPNGKRLFFTWFWPGWDLYYSDWDSTISNWGPAINCGPNVNTPEYAEGGCVLPNDTTLIFLSATDAHISYWDSQTQTWRPSERWPTQNLYFNSDWGIYVSPNFKKVYDTHQRSDTTINGEPYLNYDIVVSYQDTTMPKGYTRPHNLNFCLYADTQYFAGNYVGRFEGFPTLTPDGKKMYFTADYDSQTTIYESTMLIDENGNPVSVREEHNTVLSEDIIELYPAYPNPFNPNTTIRYKIAYSGNVTIALYDLLGQKVTELFNGEKATGEYEVIINAEKLKLSSGTYIVVLKTEEQRVTQKINFIK